MTGAQPAQKAMDAGVIAVVRLSTPLPPGAAVALVAGGVALIEITLTTPGALTTIAQIASDVPGSMPGAGTVLDVQSARDAIAAGARFVVSPTLDEHVVRACREQNVLCIPGALTPTEMLRAWRAGADMVKVFPSSPLGPGFFRDVLAPMPFLKLVPSGGVSQENAAEWIRAGAAAVSVGTSFINAQSVHDANHAALTASARRLVTIVADARRALSV
jgi:2-dehydro-3-deoxyphosphogluconate aldolase/(4S)-4-hydroxy-2-oxoglutarate aldolase